MADSKPTVLHATSTRHNTYKKNTTTLVPPARCLPEVSNKQLSKLVICHKINLDRHNMAMFFCITNYFFILFLFSTGSHTCWLKVSFLKVILVIFLCRCTKMMRTNLSYPPIFLATLPLFLSCFGFVLARGGGCHGHQVFDIAAPWYLYHK